MGATQPWARTEPASPGGVPPVVVLGWPDLERLADAMAAAGGPDPIRTDTANPARSDTAGPVTMSVDQAARYLGISRSHAYDLVRSGTIPHLRLGRRIVIPRRDLDAMIRRGAGGQVSR